jgi:hypothetical protein
MHMIWYAQPEAGVPTGAVQDEHDLLLRTGSCLTGELGQFNLEDGDADGRGQMKERAA